ncbi:MAG: MBL fold metallo-hydrolase [bacterium]|jgi:ribonuclease BN (tRNA processing enzyme)|nr:MBL fold metallo-hydrolase [Bacillota bacterium]HHW55757.1 MBL fold metallo-hydrolase [Bacillota bacterium]
MELTVLGNNGPYPGAGRACSGYLLTQGNTSLLLDCGSGVVARFRQYLNLNRLTAVVLSHLHYDHISDLYVLRYALEAARRGGLRQEPLPIYCPAEPEDVFSSLQYKDNFLLKPVQGGDTLEIGDFTVSFLWTVHPVPSVAVGLKGGGRRFIYTGDTEYFAGLVPFVAGANLLLSEANYRHREVEAGKGNHLSAHQAACLAREAGVEKLLLTHLYPEGDEGELLAEAREVFPQADLAREGGIYRV